MKEEQQRVEDAKRWKCTYPDFAEYKHVSLSRKQVEELIEMLEGGLTWDDFVEQKGESESISSAPEQAEMNHPQPTVRPNVASLGMTPTKQPVYDSLGRKLSDVEVAVRDRVRAKIAEMKAEAEAKANAEAETLNYPQYNRDLKRVEKFAEPPGKPASGELEPLPVSESEYEADVRACREAVSKEAKKEQLQEIADARQLEIRRRIQKNNKENRARDAEYRKLKAAEEKEEWFRTENEEYERYKAVGVDWPKPTEERWKAEKPLRTLEKAFDKKMKEKRGSLCTFEYMEDLKELGGEEYQKHIAAFQRAGREWRKIGSDIRKQIKESNPQVPEDVNSLKVDVGGDKSERVEKFVKRVKQQYINDKVAKGEWPSKYYKTVGKRLGRTKRQSIFPKGLGFGGTAKE
jgi:hypothetical protein